jgi:hypothetical protein
VKQALLRFALIPGLVLPVVTLVRAQLEVRAPAAPITWWVSSTGPTLLLLLVWPALLLRRGMSLGGALVVMFVLLLLARLPISAVYALAWNGHWTVAGTDRPVRYVAQSQSMFAGVGGFAVFWRTLVGPVVVGTVVSLLVWFVAWRVAFRGKRPLLKASGAAPSR